MSMIDSLAYLYSTFAMDNKIDKEHDDDCEDQEFEVLYMAC